jgi:pantoate--beta-alanine ligase
MRLFETIGQLRPYLRSMRSGETGSIGFVPTMGALHPGHISLIRKAKADCDLVIVSIFVNPKQFGPTEDFSAYPRPMSRDQQICSDEGADALFVPDAAEIYPSGFQTSVEISEITSVLEGACRPGHFSSVATVVLKLNNIVQPDRLYMGQKDFQQALVIERMAQDLNLATEIVTVPTVREPDGLAISSRNSYLTETERKAAVVLHRCLAHARDKVLAGAQDGAALLSEMEAIVAAEPLAKADYVTLANPQTLKPVTSLAGTVTLAALAVRIGTTRLIDNMLIAPSGVNAVRPRAVN